MSKPIKFSDLCFYKLLQNGSIQNQSAASYLSALKTFTDNAENIVKKIKTNYPQFSKENITHARNVLGQLEQVLEKNALQSLNDAEIFVLIASALFHDLTAFYPAYFQSPARIKEIQIKELTEFIFSFWQEKLFLEKTSLTQLTDCIIFLIKSLHAPWEEIASTEDFKNPKKINDRFIRIRLLLCLLRTSDLLDFSGSRQCNVLNIKNPDNSDLTSAENFDAIFSNIHTLILTPREIQIAVVAKNKEEHIFWSEWFGYLKQDIYFANTSVFIGENKAFQLPIPNIDIQQSETADYDIWPLRFELDESGRIWKIISQAVYTSRYDFLREVIQNAIDADLFRIYDDDTAEIPAISPRCWQLNSYDPQVMILFSEKLKFLEIKDNGTGMDENALQYFLFKIAQTGYEQQEKKRDFQFPAIAKFGIGFISILLRATKVIVKTRALKALSGRKITLQTEARNAYCEIEECDIGTSVQLQLKDKYSATEMAHYLQKFYRYPSVPVFFIDLDKVVNLSQLASGLNLETPELLMRLADTHALPDSGPPLEAYQNQINSTVKAVKTALEIDQTETGEAQPDFENIFLKMHENIIRQIPLQSPLVFYLDSQFEILKIKPVSEIKSKQIALGLVFIPVSFKSYELGIEWESLHCFVIHNNEIKRSLVRYSGIAEEFDDPDKTIYLSKEEIEDDDNYESELIVIDTLDVIRKFRSQHNKGDMFPGADQYDIYEEIFLISDEIMSRRDEFDGYPVPFLDKKGSRLKRESETTIDEYKPVYQSVEILDNEVFQDGIKIPVHAWALTPLGMCRAQGNFTGNARLELNVTRNAINESPVLLASWVDNYGKKLHAQILRILTATFDTLNCSYKIKELVVPKKDSDQNVLFRYTSNALMNWKDSDISDL